MIGTDPYNLKSVYSMENENGLIQNKNAWVALANRRVMGAEVRPDALTGVWNVRLKPVSDNKTSININLVGIVGTTVYDQTEYSRRFVIDHEGRSTGVFEREIGEQMK